ncbi:hypothetical protein PQX77_013502 [Marasmius sp. AFHP31]|nr:hypothetical protein PQX77_013502 [Marasmius sp. AFHP31]
MEKTEFALPVPRKKSLSAQAAVNGAASSSSALASPSPSTATFTPTTPTPQSVFTDKDKDAKPSDSPTTPLPPSPRTPQTNTNTNTEQQQPIVIPSPPSSPTTTMSLAAAAASATSPVSKRFSTASRHSTNSTSGLGAELGLTSSRPAPPSPAMSRRASGVYSTRSPERERDKRGSLLSAGVIAGLGFTAISSTEKKEGEEKEKERRQGMSYRSPIRIRDYAFTEGDVKHLGMGKEVPKPNRVRLLNRRLLGEEGWRLWRKAEKARRRGDGNARKRARESMGSVGSAASSVYSEDEWEEGGADPESDEDEDSNGWGSLGNFKFGMGRFSWGGSSSSSKGNTPATTTSDASPAASTSNRKSTPAGFPTQTDLDRNFADSSESSDTEEDDYDDAEDGASGRYYSASASPMPEGEDADYADAGEEDLLPGLYKALYAFEPEGTAEMALREDQLVHVVGRGGGVGWAVVVVDGVNEKGDYVELPDEGEGKKRHALVPESYLEVVRLDGESES